MDQTCGEVGNKFSSLNLGVVVYLVPKIELTIREVPSKLDIPN